jgi:UDP-N-acetylglucosamine 4,6-dehydratase
MRQEFNQYSNLRYFIGDVHDRKRLYRALEGVDIVFHTATLHLPFAAEYNPFEAVKTNIIGAMNLIDAAIDCKVDKVIAISTVSSINPATLSGLTRRTSERVIVAGNCYSGLDGTRFSVIRIGSVFGIKTNPILNFQRMSTTGTLSVSDTQRTRFWMTYEDIVQFTITCLQDMVKGEIFVPKLPSIRDVDLARAVAPKCKIKVVGLNPGEVLHEVLLSEDDSQFALEYDHYYTIVPFYQELGRIIYFGPTKGIPCHAGFRYSSDTNPEWLSVDKMRKILKLD